METANRPLHALDPNAVDAHIDRAIDELFVPKSASAAAQPPPSDGLPEGVAIAEDTETSAKAPEAPLDGLQEAVLSLEWEICERHVLAFEQEALAVGERYASDRHVGAIVQMAAKVSKYLLVVGEGATPAGMGFPTAVLRALETLLRQPTPSAAERKAAVEALLEKYRWLQAEARRQQRKPFPRPAAAAGHPPPSPAHAPPEEVDRPQGSDGRADPAVDATEGTEAFLAEELEPEDATEIDELEPEDEEELEPEPDLRPGTVGPAPAWGIETGLSPGGREPAPEPPEQHRAPAHPSWKDDWSAPASSLAAMETSPEAGPTDAPPETARRLPAFLEKLRERLQERLGHVRRAAADGSPQWMDQLTELGDVMETGLTSALEMARQLGSAPEEERAALGARLAAPDAAAFRADLDRIRDAIEALTATVQAIDGRIRGPTGDGPSGAPRSTIQTAPASGAPAAAPAYLAAVGGSPVGIPAPFLVKAVPLSPRLAERIRDRGYATLKDFRSPFRSLKSGISGPLAGRSSRELGLLRFSLAPHSADAVREPGGAALLSDGRTHAVLFTDRVLEGRPQAAAEHPLFRLGGKAASPLV
jgi:hypothetical protein